DALDTSPLSIYVMHPFWNRVVEWCPKWIAPNLLTFVGFLFTVLNFLMFTYYDYDFYASSDVPEVAPVPRWVWGVAAISIFLAYTLDGIDGKQARRTQTSGPLGELFDHGLDSWTAFLIPTCMYSVFGRGSHSIAPIRMYFCLWNIFINFYLSHWEKYNTGVLFLPWGYDASMVASILIFLVTSIFGHEAWAFKLPGGMSAGHMFELTFYICAIISNLPIIEYGAALAANSQTSFLSYRDGTGKMRTFSEAMRPLVPVIVFLVICSIWVFYSPYDVVNKDPRCVYLVTGTIFSNICCRLIVSQMSSTRCEIFNWMIIPFGSFVALSFVLPSTGGPSLELVMLYAMAVFVTVAHIYYGSSVVRQMCRHFRINCFRVMKYE
ncbi:hypothetical protein L9F63_022946, partial [Diploptera punctata]